MDKGINIFGLKTMRNHYALMPLVAITGAACTLCAGYVSYMCLTKNDLSWRPWSYSTKPPYMNVEPEQVNKFYNYHAGKIYRNAEIEALRKEIGSAQ